VLLQFAAHLAQIPSLDLESEVMPKRSKTDKQNEPELWVAPRYSLKGPAGERAWENRPGGPPNSSRYLELADLALGLKKPAPRKKHSSKTHDKGKLEPYSQQ
jgi:hypothetical protein